MDDRGTKKGPWAVVTIGAMSLGVVLAGGGSTAVSVEGSTVTQRVSLDSQGAQGDSASGDPTISAGGRYVAFDSYASNLVPGDTNGVWDSFVRDRATGTTRRVSVSSDGAEGNASSGNASISADGRFVAFGSMASNLAPGEMSGVFVHTLATGRTERVSVSSSGVPGTGETPAISSDGRYVAFASSFPYVTKDTNSNYDVDVYVRDRVQHTTRRISVSSNGEQSNGFSGHPAISADGRYVAFDSYASNLVPNDTGTWDVFVRDRLRRTTEKVSVNVHGRRSNGASMGQQAISANGRYVAFTSGSSDLVPRDTNDQIDVFVRDRVNGTTRRVSVTRRGGNGNNWSHEPTISSGGRYVVFSSSASNLVPSDTNGHIDVFVWDRATGTNTWVSISSSGTRGNQRSESAAVSAKGRYVAFQSDATTLVLGDTNDNADVFVRDRGPR